MLSLLDRLEGRKSAEIRDLPEPEPDQDDTLVAVPAGAAVGERHDEAGMQSADH